jgi:hypothetical protein
MIRIMSTQVGRWTKRAKNEEMHYAINYNWTCEYVPIEESDPMPSPFAFR